MASHARIKELFHACLELPGEQRPAYLTRACGTDRVLRRVLAAMLEFDQREQGFLAAPPAASEEDFRPRDFGPFRLLGKLGEGGMGVVYEARQEHPGRTVALKVLRPAFFSAQARRRLEREGELLARLQHPGIAQVHAAGQVETEDGPQPYVVMELVRGRPLGEYAAQERLAVRGRLELVARIADAVQHAHQQGVIHRDLKPDNILVDGSGQPRILDFGIARASDSDVQLTTQHTDMGQILGTLAYMSPEQATGDGAAIDTRSDVYSLGVVLFELLTGQLPHEVTRLPLPEALRTIREQEPRRLSTLKSRLRGDLQTIVGKALEKDRERRYAHAADLAADLRRFLADEPIRARPPSRVYTLTKFARRHRTLVGATLAVILALGLGLAAALSFGLREAEARRVAEHDAYRANLVVARRALEEGRPEEGRELLERSPEDLRNWEWHNLFRHTSWELARVSLPGVFAAGYLDETRVLAVDEGGALWLVDMVTGRVQPAPARRAPGTWPPGRALALTEDLRWLLTEADGELCLGEPLGSDPPRRLSLDGHMPLRGPRTCAVAGDGSRVLVTTPDSEVVQFEASSTARVVPQDEPLRPVSCVAFHPDGELFVIRRPDHQIYDAVTLEALWGGRVAQRGELVFTPDGTATLLERSELRGPGVGSLLVRRAEDGAVLRKLPRSDYRAHPFLLEGNATVSRDQRHIALAYPDGQLVVLDTGLDGQTFAEGFASASVTATHLGHQAHGTGDFRVQFSPNGSSLLAVEPTEGYLRLWRSGSEPLTRTLRGHSSHVYGVAFLPDGAALVSGAWDHTVRLWDAELGRELAALPMPDKVLSLALSPDGRTLACGTADGLLVVDVETGGVRATLDPSPTLAVSFTPDGARLAGCARSGHVRVWETRTLEQRVEFKAGNYVPAMAFDRTGQWIATGTIHGVVKLTEASSGKSVASLDGPGLGSGYEGRVYGFAFSPDGERVLVARGDGRLSVLALPSLAEIEDWNAQEGEVLAVAWSPDGSRVASGGRDGLLRLWDARTGELLVRLEGHADYLMGIAFSPDGRRIATASGDGTVRVWDSAPVAVAWRARETRRRARASAGNADAEGVHAGIRELTTTLAPLALEDPVADELEGLATRWRAAAATSSPLVGSVAEPAPSSPAPSGPANGHGGHQ